MVKREASVGAPVHAQFDRLVRALFRILDLRPKREDRTSADIKRNPLEGCLGCDATPARYLLATPEIVPSAGRWQIKRTSRRALFGNRIHQNRRTEHELIPDRCH